MSTTLMNPWKRFANEGSISVTLPEDEYQKQVDEENARVANIDINIGDRERSIHIDNTDEMLAYVFKTCDEALYVARRMRLQPGNESLGTMARNATLGIANSVIMLGNLLTTGLFHGWRDFKRSELTEYVDSNRVTIPLLYKVPFGEVVKLELPVPQGMKKPYMDAVVFLTEYLERADMKRTVKAMYEVTLHIAKTVRSGSNIFADGAMDKIEALQLDLLKNMFNESWKIFEADSKDFSELPFKKCFKSLTELKQCVDMTQDMDRHLRDVAGTHDTVEKLEKTFKNILNYKGAIDDKSLETLAVTTRSFAECISNYATVINDLNRVQHNLTICLQYIRRATGY